MVFRIPPPFLWIIACFILAGAFQSGCRKNDLYTGADAALAFSDDTLTFDTIFTQLGGTANPQSAYQYLKVYNRKSGILKTTLWIAGGSASPFRMNVDGEPVREKKSFDILPGDSIYVFIEALLDQSNSNNPLIITDSLMFETNGQTQRVVIDAWGQDAHYITDSILPCNSVWTNDKPYVIYKSMLVDAGCKLSIMPGTRVYNHVGSRIYVAGTLEANGTASDPVIFQGDRLEYRLRNTPGQWVGIRFLPGSWYNKLTYTEVKNALLGIEVDSLPNSDTVPNLSMRQCKVQHCSLYGVVGKNASLSMWNCLVANCGQYAFIGTYGGTYNLQNCTFASFNTVFNRQTPLFALSNQDLVDPDTKQILQSFNLAYVVSECIIYGSLDDELILDDSGKGSINGVITHTNIKTKLKGLNRNGNQINQDPKFVSIGDYNFHLQASSPCKAAGQPIQINGIDLEGNQRQLPNDLGCYRLQ